MTLAERLSEYVRACFTGIWVQSFEHDDAIVDIARLCRHILLGEPVQWEEFLTHATV